MVESISKFNFHGIEYIEVRDLLALMKDMIKKYEAGQEPGYMITDRQQRVAAYMAISHLRSIINREKNRVGMHEQLEKTRVEREAREAAEDAEHKEECKCDGTCKKEQKPKAAHMPKIPARYTIWHYGADADTTQNSFCFVRWEDKMPVFSNRPCMAMWFVDKGMAEKTVEKLGAGFEVVDMLGVMTAEERLLRAIFYDGNEDVAETTEG